MPLLLMLQFPLLLLRTHLLLLLRLHVMLLLLLLLDMRLSDLATHCPGWRTTCRYRHRTGMGWSSSVGTWRSSMSTT